MQKPQAAEEVFATNALRVWQTLAILTYMGAGDNSNCKSGVQTYFKVILRT